MNESEHEIIHSDSTSNLHDFSTTEIKQQPKTAKPNLLTNNQVALSQIRGIFLKTLSFQSRQTATNVFQLLIPTLCFALMALAHYQIKLSVQSDLQLKGIGQIPFLFNLPWVISPTSKINPIDSSDCNRWYLVKKPDSPTLASLTAQQLTKPQFPQHCQRTNSLTPTVRTTSHDLTTTIFETLLRIEESPFTFGVEMQGLDELPDGGFDFSEISQHKVALTIHVNDLLFQEFHRNNGISKFSFRLPKNEVNLASDLKQSIEQMGSQFNNKSVSEVLSADLSFDNNLTLKDTLVESAKRKVETSRLAFRRYFNRKSVTLPVR